MPTWPCPGSPRSRSSTTVNASWGHRAEEPAIGELRIMNWECILIHNSQFQIRTRLHTKMGADDVIGEGVDGAAGHAAPFFENAELARHAPRERQLLLDQQHCQSRIPVERENDVADL